MIRTLLQDEIRKKGLSIRAAAQQIGVAHTTVIRLLDDQSVDLETLRKICSWLNVEVGTILNSPDKTEKSIVEKFSCILQKNPGLHQLFDEYYAKMEYCEISMLDLEEILAFMVFRMYYRKPCAASIVDNMKL
jgi:DNA-binding Xre family transcriptional regulator